MKTVDKYQFNEDNCFMQDGIPTYIALHTVLKKKFIVKMITYGTDREKENNNYLAKECQILKKITHQNVYKCHKLLKSKNNFYAVFDLIEGKTLQQMLKQDTSLQCKAKILKQLIQLLLELKSKNIVYNVNPSKIIVEENYKIVAKNFGFAQEFQPGQNEKYIRFNKPDPNQYAPPELLQGKLYKNSDLYSLGVLITALFYAEFKKASMIKQNIPIVLENFGINVNLSIEKMKKIAEEFSKIDTLERPELKESLTSKKAYVLAPSPQKQMPQQCLRSKVSSKTHFKSPRAAEKKHLTLTISKSASILTGSEDKNRQKIQNFEKLTQVILKKRVLANLFLKISETILNSPQSQLSTAIQLSYLLVKKAKIAASQLSNLLNKGINKQYFLTQKSLQTFRKEPSFDCLFEIISHQANLAQQKYKNILAQMAKIEVLSTNENLQHQMQKESSSDSYLTKIVLEFLLVLNLIPSEDYASQFKKDELYYIYITSLLADFKTLEEVYECFFTQEVTQMKDQPFYQQISLIPKKKLVELIEKNTTKLYSQTSGSFELSVITTKTTKTFKTTKSIK